MISPEERDALGYAYLLGMAKAASDAGMEKEAIVGSLLGRLGGLGMKFVGGGKSLAGGVKSLASGVNSATAKPFSWAGRLGEKGLSKAMGPKSWAKWKKPIRSTFKGAPRDMATFGLFSGGINSLLAEPGERGSAFLKGFGSGALSGLGWRAGSNLAAAGLGRAGVLTAAGKKISPQMSAIEKAKTVGARGARSALPYVGGFAGSMAIDPSMYGSGHGATPPAPKQTWQPKSQAWGQGSQAWR